ncbi:sugar ABC transporter permease [Streptomyces spiralis]|uniref:sugar ABC transporter permease n=1 Tax=Streptomyces spiralis TaxID=66376 RepID=UPI00368FCFBC
MTSLDTSVAPATDLQDERLTAPQGIGGHLRAAARRVRDGDLGMLPVVAGIVVIWTIFQALNRTFLSSTNLVNLSFDMVPIGVIALGIVCVLLAGQIDLSVGSVSGLSAATTAVVMVRHEQPMVVAILAAVAAGCLIGWIYGQAFNRFGVPSFVATLGGLLAFLGAQLWLLRGQNAINIPYDSTLVKFAQVWFVPGWLSYLLAVAAAGGFLAAGWIRSRSRRRAGLSSSSLQWLLAQSLLLLAVLLFAVYYLNRTRGVAWMFVLFVALVLTVHYTLRHTRFGRSIYAVGGNAEAARRAGIDVPRVYTSAFVMCSGLAAFGGILFAARLAAANQSTGTADVNLNAIAAAVIGGTSLFGGRGSAFAALLGVLVIQSISSGLTLLNLDSSYRFVITGAVLIVAVALDSAARRSRQAHGRG